MKIYEEIVSNRILFSNISLIHRQIMNQFFKLHFPERLAIIKRFPQLPVYSGMDR